MATPVKALVKSICSDRAWEHIRHVGWRLWDRWHNVETSRPVDLNALSVVGTNRSHALPYEASGSIRTILNDLVIDFERYGFLDFGSGKGRVLLAASQFPFKSVLGVEFAIELHKTAENNIRQYRRAKVRCGALKSILADATAFELPSIPLVLYFFNPFSGPVLAAVIANIERSLAIHPRELRIICAGKRMSKEAFDNMPNMQVVWRREHSTVYRLLH